MNTNERNRRVLSVRERNMLKRDISLCERDMSGGIGTPEKREKSDGGVPMPERMKRRLEGSIYNVAPDPGVSQRWRRAKEALAMGDPGSLSDAEKLEIEKRVKRFEEDAVKVLMPRRMNARRAKDEGFRESVQAALREHDPAFKKRITQYKNDMRRLDPDNPEAGNIEKLRPE